VIGLAVTVSALPLLLGDTPRRPYDGVVPPQPPPFGEGDTVLRTRKLGTPTTVYVNFDGIDLGSCSPSNAKKNCHWYNHDPIAPFSGDLQTRVAILDAMRRHVDDFGIRVTGARPNDGDYTMVVYGGTEEEYEALGSAPSGDCNDTRPNEIAFAHLDGDRVQWIVAGSTTALHEAAHTWGLDHIDLETEIMYPEGDDSPTAFDERCHRIVDGTDLSDGEPSCPDVNAALCEATTQQSSYAVLRRLFGPGYADVTAPVVRLAALEDGAYFQAPASFDVVLEIEDDLHPQGYEMWTWLGDEARPAEATRTLAPGFAVEALPTGTWSFHVVVADAAGNEGRLDFEIEVGVDPPPQPDDEGGCRVAGAHAPRASWAATAALVFGPIALVVRRRRR
jgi:hypothetical protein